MPSKEGTNTQAQKECTAYNMHAHIGRRVKSSCIACLAFLPHIIPWHRLPACRLLFDPPCKTVCVGQRISPQRGICRHTVDSWLSLFGSLLYSHLNRAQVSHPNINGLDFLPGTTLCRFQHTFSRMCSHHSGRRVSTFHVRRLHVTPHC